MLQGRAAVLQDLVVQTRGLPGLDTGIAADRRLDRAVSEQLAQGLVAAGMLLQKQLGGDMPELVLSHYEAGARANGATHLMRQRAVTLGHAGFGHEEESVHAAEERQEALDIGVDHAVQLFG